MKILEKEKRVIKKSTLIKTILLCLVLIAMLVCFSIAKKVKREEQIVLANGDMELLRAMSYEELNNSDELTNSDFVRFSAFFLRDTDLDGYANKIKGTAKELGTSDTLYMSLAVLAEGTFKDGTIEIIGENFYFQTALIDDEVIDGNYIDANTSLINLKDVRVGTQKLFFGNVRSGNYSNGQHTAAIGNDISKYSKVNKVILRGVHVKDDGTETYVVKEVEFPVDWYSTVKAEIPSVYAGDRKNKYQSYDLYKLLEIMENKETVEVDFRIASQEVNNKLNISKAYLEGEIPTLAGYDPLSVEIEGVNIDYTYDENSRMFTIKRNSLVNMYDEVITEAYTGQHGAARYNEYQVTVTYPMAAYNALGIESVNLMIPVRAYYEGYNNPNEEFENPIRSNIAEDVVNVIYERGGGNVLGFEVNVGSWAPHPYGAWIVSKQPADYAYNNKMQEDFKYLEDTYETIWLAGRGSDSKISAIRMEEPDEKYYDEIVTNTNAKISLEGMVTNVGIYFSGAGNTLGEDGYINVFNDVTGELIHTFTIEDWDLYNKESPYKYETPVEHIRVETSLMTDGKLYVYNIKRLDDEKLTNKFTKEEFDTFRMIGSNLYGSAKIEEDDEFEGDEIKSKYANYDLEKSILTIAKVNPSYFTTQEIKENVEIVIRTNKLAINTSEWMNGAFLVKLPKEVLSFEVNNLTISNPEVKLLGYSVEEKSDGIYLKILTENENPTVYDITIDCKIIPDPRIISSEKNIEVYAANEYATSYTNEVTDIYDVDDDGNTEEVVTKVSSKITFIGPTSLITMETATEYNFNHDRLETIIAPQVAIIDKTQDDKTAVIQASILNNYSGTISEIKLVGKIPFEGNTFQLVNKELGSKITTEMLGKITVPEALKEYAKIYYSENEIVNENLNDPTNNWIPEDEITDFSKVKCYLIDLGSYVMTKGEEQICEYKIRIPNTVNYNDVTYSTHAVYFSLNTVEGKLRDRTETNKLGFMIARKYNLEINKTKKGTETLIKGATFSIEEEGQPNTTKILTTDLMGQINLTDLYVDRVYVIKEIRAPYDYVLNSQEIKIKATVNEETGELEVIKLSGETKDEITVQDRELGKTVVVNLENEPKYTFNLTKTTEGTGEPIKGVRFRIYGKGMPASGRTAVTNKNGVLSVSGLYPGETYSIIEEYAKGYEYSETPIEFKAVWDGNILVPEVISGAFDTEPVIDNNQIAQPIMYTGVENKKLREYSFELIKYEEESFKTLSDAIFEISGKWIKEQIVTDEDGKIIIPTLYENIEYTLEEIIAPEGYSVSENKIKFAGSFNDEGKLIIRILEGSLVDKKVIEELENSEDDNVTDDEAKVENKIENVIENTIENKIENTVTNTVVENTVIENTIENIVDSDVEISEELEEENVEELVKNIYGEIQDSNGEIYEEVEADIVLAENGNTLFSMAFDNEPLFKLTKFDGTTQEVLPNVKFAIFKINVDGTEEEAKDTEGNLIGEEYKINDVTYRVIETDAKGEITADLPEGYYKVVEVETLEAYVLPEDIATRTYIFAIGRSRPALKEVVETMYKSGEGFDTLRYKSVSETDNGGYVVAGSFINNIKLEDINVETGENIELISSGYNDGVLVKYNSENFVEWVTKYGSANLEELIDVVSLSNGNLLVSGYRGLGNARSTFHLVYDLNGNLINEYLNLGQTSNNITPTMKIREIEGNGFVEIGNFNQKYIIPAESTIEGEEITLSTKGSYDSYIIKYDNNHMVEWARSIGSTGNNYFFDISVANNNTIGVVGNFIGTLDISAEEFNSGVEMSLTSTGDRDSLFINYNIDGKINWLKHISSIEGSSRDDLEGIIAREDGFIVMGEFYATTFAIPGEDTVSGEELTTIRGGAEDAIIIKYNFDGKAEWLNYINSSGGDEAERIANTKDGGYIVAGRISSKFTALSENTASGEQFIINPNIDSGVIIKYNKENKIEWISDIGFDGYINTGVTAWDVAVTNENEYVVIGNPFERGQIIPGNLTVSGEEMGIVASKTANVLIKCNEYGLVDFIRSEYNSTHNIKDIKYLDDGFIAVGTFSGVINFYEDETATAEKMKIQSKGSRDAFLIKYNNDAKVEWVKKVGDFDVDEYESILVVEDGYIVVGHTVSTTLTYSEDDMLNGEKYVYKNSGDYDGLIVKYTLDGKVEWINSLNTAGGDELESITKTTDGGYIVGGRFSKTLNISADKTEIGQAISITPQAADMAVLLKYNNENKLQWITELGAKFYILDGINATVEKIVESSNGDIFCVVRTSSSFNIIEEYTEKGIAINVTTTGLKGIALNSEGKVKYVIDFPGLMSVVESSDGGSIVIGVTNQTIEIPADATADGDKIVVKDATSSGYMIKFNADGLVEWGNINKGLTTMTIVDSYAIKNDGYVLVGSSNTINIPAEETTSGRSVYIPRGASQLVVKYSEDDRFEWVNIDNRRGTLKAAHYIPEENKIVAAGLEIKNSINTVAIAEYKEFITDAEIPSQQLIEVPNYKKELNITTEVKVHDDGTKGGTISGEGESPYEVVVYGENATKEIIITPDENYKILTLTINDVAYPYTIEDDGTVRINLENVTENKHIVVGFSNTISEVLVHHYIDGTEDKVADDQSIVGMIGARYTTAPVMDLEDYEVIVEKIPSNASGMFTAETQEVIYYYQEKKVMVTVNHYLEGTTDKLSESTISEYLKGEEYSTTKADDINVKYELVAVPSNSTGTVTDNLTVNYYYRVKKYNITTKVEGLGGDITGSGNITLEEVEHGDDSTTEIVITPEEGFYVENVTINGTPVDFITGPNNIVTLDKFTGMIEDKEVIVTFARTEGQVIVHHYIEGTTDKVPSNVEGEVVEDEIKIGYVGDSFATMESANIAEYYELSSKSEETSGVYTEVTQEIYYYYKLKQYNYTVEYYYDGNIDNNKTENIVATWGDVISTYTDKNITGYTLEKEENLSLTITQDESTNVIKVYYVKDKFNYTVEYYFEGEIDSAKTDVIEATYLDEIKTYTDKVEVGYKLSRVETIPLTITENENNNIIKVFYVIDENQTKEKVYTVEYYKDGVKVEADTQVTTETVQVLESDTMTVNKDLINTTNKYFGYKLDGVNTIIPDTVTSGDVIKVYYVTDESHTKTLFYTVEYYKDNVFADRDIKQDNVQVLQPDTLRVDKAAINMVDKYVGYKFEKVEPENIPDTISNGGVIKVYYVRDTFGYSVEYYFDGVIDSNLTENYTALYNDEITSYTDKVKVGYKLHVVETIPMKVTENSANNVIRIYYVIDELQTKDLSYTVEYYKDGVKVDEDTQVESETVQILDDDILNVDKSKINLVDKYYGYKLDAENTVVPDEVTTGSVIRVYYVTDDGNTKNLSYTVEYYKDGIKVDSDTDIKTITVQVLQPDTLNVDKAAINMVDKYVGYKFEKVEPTNIPDTVTDGTVIKVYYVRDTFEYRMEYYFNGVIDDTLTDTYTALYNEQINDHVDKVKVGYTLERVDPLPLTVTEVSEDNVMRIYYVIDETQTKYITYSIEFYKDGVKQKGEDAWVYATVHVLGRDDLPLATNVIYDYNKYVGYKWDHVEPSELPDRVNSGDVIKVYYVRDTFEYSMEYYFDGIKDETLTDNYTALYNEKINNHVDKVKEGYTLEKVEPLPLTVTENDLNNVMRIYYTTDELQAKDLSYIVEYYKDGVLVSADTQVETETVQVLKPDTMTVDKTKINLVDKYFGYKLDSATVVPDIVNSGDTIKVYYVTDENQTKELSYTVEYYKDGVKVDADTQIEISIVQVLESDIITVDKTKINLSNKYVGYKLDTENTIVPDSVTTGSVIKVYYVRDTFSYSVEYYFDGVIDTALTDTFTALYGDVIDTYEDKVKVGYKYNRDTAPLTIDVTDNVIKVYYVIDYAQRKEISYSVEYYKEGVCQRNETKWDMWQVHILSPDVLNVDKDFVYIYDKYPGYRLDHTDPEVVPDTINNGGVIKVYYVKDTFDYTIEYYYDGIKDDSKTEVGSALFESTIDTYTDKVIEGYVFEKVEGNPITIDFDITKNVMKVYYTKRTDLSYTVKYLEEGTENVLAQEKVVNNQTFKDIVTENAIDIEGYDKVETTKSIEITTGINEIIFYYTKRNDLSYRVEYYFDNVIDNALTETVNNQVYESVIDTYQDKVKVGYKLDSDTAPITIGIGENLIKVYYVTDEAQTKELSYTVEYYKDGVRVDSDTQIEAETVQILEDNIMNVNLSKINVVNKYVGYKLSALDPVTLPSQVESGAVIRVYYVRDSYNYTVEYYYNNVIDSNATERINAKYNDEITTYEDKVKPGYKLDRAEVPFTVTEVEENNIIRVYYVTDDAQTKELSYTVEYYKDGVLTDTEVEKETVQLLEDDKLAVRKDNINMTNKYVGYKFEKVEPENIPDEVDTGSVIKVYYVRDTFGYTIEYYYNNVIDDTLTENKTALYGVRIETFTNNVKDGYIQGKVENIPLIITEDESQNIMRVFYEIDPTQVKELSYTVEYYKDGVKVEADTQVVSKTVQLLDDNILEVNVSDINTTDKYVGYKLENTEPNVIPTEVVTGSVIKVYYVKDNFDYTVEYYYENVIEPSKTDVISATYQDVIDTYTDKVITGYEFDKVEGTPLTITENESTNVIKVYYKKARFAYTVEYYYDGNINDSKTETLEGIYDERIESYTSKEEYGYKFDGVFNLPLRISENEEQNVIKVYYVRKDSTVSVQFVDKVSGNIISPEVVKEGKVFDTFDITNDVKEIEGYTLIESPSTLTGTFEEETQSFTYYYAKTSEVKVKYLEEGTNIELSNEETIVGYEGKEYSTVKKDILNYTFVKDTENVSGVMTDRTITVIYYYAQNTKVTVNYIDKNTGAILDQVVAPGKVGDEYTSSAKDITYYVLVQSPVRETVTMTKDEIVLEYYYAHVSAGVIEKHIDIKSGELLDNKEHVGNEGDSYTTNSKIFDGYDLVVEMLPENASGTMTIDVIEVKYYYIRRTMVIVEYVDNLTGEVLKDYEGVDIDGDGLIDDIAEIDSIVVIEGHEGDNYTTEEKSFDGYDLVMEKYPANSKGTMEVIVDEDGKTTVITNVTYYYALKTKVTVSYIDVISGEVIDTEVINGHEGDEYETERKEIDGYDIVIESIPENEKGIMTEEPIEVKYYYRAKATVTVNHIDNYTGKELPEIDSETKAEVDSSVVINGHEGDEYNTSSKSFKGYELREDKLPGNSKGYMTKGNTVVNYYYSYKSSVKVLYIEKATGKNITDSVVIEGYEGDNYKATAKDVDGYKLIEVPGEESGKITKDQKTIVYYYEKLSGGVKINYIDIHNNNMLGGETITGIVGDSFEANFKQFEGYELVIERLPSSNKGTLQEGVIEINYYYRKIGTDVTTPVITPPTGDSIINGLIVVAYTVLAVNVITLIKKKRNAKKE